MDVLLVNHAEVRALLSMSECIDVMTRTFETLGHGNVVQPLRPIMWLPERIGALDRTVARPRLLKAWEMESVEW